MTKNKLIIKRKKLAGKETSLSKVSGQKSKSKPLELSHKEYIRKHIEHFVLCLRDAFGFRDPMEVIDSVTLRLESLFPDTPIEKVMKWFYGNALGWSTNNFDDIQGQPSVDALGLNSQLYPDACKIFGGRLSCFLHKFFRRQVRHTKSLEWKRRRSSFSKAQTFLMFKKGSPQVSEKLIREADLKHKEAMSSLKGVSNRKTLKEVSSRIMKPTNLVQSEWHQTINWNYEEVGGWGDYEVDYVDPASLQKSIEQQATKIVDRLFKPGCFKKIMKKEQTLFPSSSAHEEHNAQRKFGGAVNIVKDLFGHYVEGGLDKMDYHPRVGVREHREIIYRDVDVASSLLNNEFLAEPVYLQEPLKVRTITKGPSVPYWFFRPIQKFLWSTLQSHPTFALIGTPISSEILNQMLPFATSKDAKWLSGDYSAATDNLVRWLSKHIWSQICLRTGMPDSVYLLGKKGLIGHKIRYKKLDGVGFDVIEQKNGQLMGSPLSFPILCLANATICSLAFSRKNKNLLKLPLRINGDDCVMHYTQEERKEWRRLAEFIGMTPSPGKCYYATDWLQMNSELFLLRKSSFKQIPFTNFSLASPYLAKGGQERTVESISQTMINFCYKKDPKWIDIFLRRMTPFLKSKVPGKISWFLPQCLGGLGLMSRKLDGDLFTTQQLKVATLFYNKGVLSKRLPYKISSIKGGKASYQLLQNLKKYERITPILDKELVPVKTFWSERFFKERDEENAFVPLLWENLVKQGKVFLEKKVEKDIMTREIFRVFQVKSKHIDPLPLSELLRFKGLDVSVPDILFRSNFEPKGVFTDTLVSLTKKDKDLLLLLG